MTFGFVVLMGAAWSTVSPPNGPPDEASHAITAVAVAHGQLLGSPLSPTERRAFLASGRGQLAVGQLSAYRAVTVPKIYGELNTACFAFRREVPASCMTFRGSRTDGSVVTPTMWYPPAYYAWVGLISSPFPAGPVSVYVMRLASVVLFAMLIASSAASLRRTAAAPVALAGLLVALTPTAFYFGASVNPNGLEIAAGIAMWSSGIVLVREPTSVDTKLVARFAGATGLLILARHPGPVWAALIALVLLTLATPDARKRLREAVPVRWAIGGVSACLGAALVWIVIANPFSFAHQIFNNPLSTSAALRSAVGNSGGWLQAMIGVFGSDTPAPLATFVLWLMALGGLVLAAIMWGSARDRRALLLLGATAISVPIILAAIEATQIGMHWQGRYQLPFAVGLPILAATSFGSAEPPELRGTRRFATGLGVLTATAGLLAFAQVLRRYTVGYDGPIQFWKHPPWSPPISPLLLLGGFAVLTVGWVSWILRPSRPARPDQRATATEPASTSP